MKVNVVISVFFLLLWTLVMSDESEMHHADKPFQVDLKVTSLQTNRAYIEHIHPAWFLLVPIGTIYHLLIKMFDTKAVLPVLI